MNYKDPICGMDVAENTPYKSRINEETFYFCSNGCKEEFENRLATQSTQLIDPVCGMKVDSNSLFMSSFNNHDYFFCSKGCREEFEKNPSKYVNSSDRVGNKS